MGHGEAGGGVWGGQVRCNGVGRRAGGGTYGCGGSVVAWDIWVLGHWGSEACGGG